MSLSRRQFQAIDLAAVPHTRNSKHRNIVEKILQEVGDLRGNKALKVPRAALGGAKIENIRAALSRACARQNLGLATSSDDEYLYIWRQD